MSENGKRPSRSWREVAEEATKETDSQKLAETIEELCRALRKPDEADAERL